MHRLSISPDSLPPVGPSIVVRLARVLALLPASPLTQAEATGPNIIYILADDLGYGNVGIYNPASKIPTPNIDRLAKQGTRFTVAHAASSVWTHSRYAILTGWSGLKGRVPNPWNPPLIGIGADLVSPVGEYQSPALLQGTVDQVQIKFNP